MKNPSFSKASFSVIIFIVIISTLCFSFTSCNFKHSSNAQESTGTETSADYASLIVDLQNKLESIQAEQSASESENDKKIDELKNTIESLKSETSADTKKEAEDTSKEIEDSKPALVEPHFIYTTEGNSATITGYTGDDESLVIPSYIDGYKVVSIADSAFSSAKLKRVVISDGIQSIGWFSFYACDALTSITIPASVERIGHSAFSSTAKFTIYCPESSFAHKFAKSYGIDYALI